MSAKITGVISTQNLVPAGVATANSAVQISTRGIGVVGVQTKGTYTGALSAQVTVDGVNWITLGASTTFTRKTTGVQSATITSGEQDVYTVPVVGAESLRITGLAAMTGSCTVTLHDAEMGEGGGGGGGGTWGSITGTLSAQTDLQTALDAKVDEYAAVALTGANAITGAAHAFRNVTFTGAGALQTFGAGTEGDVVEISHNGTGTITTANVSALTGYKTTLATGETGQFKYTAGAWQSLIQDVSYAAAAGVVAPHRGTGWEFMAVAQIGAAGIHVIGTSGRTAIGTATLTNPLTNTSNTGNYFKRQIRTRETGAAAAISLMTGSYYHQQQGPYADTAWAGFQNRWTAGIADANAAGQFYMGLTVTVPAFSNTVNPSDQTQHFGMGADITDANMQIMHNAASTTTKIDLGAGFPANSDAVNMYDLYLAASSNGTIKSWFWRATNKTTGATNSGTVTANIPADGSNLRVAYVRGSGNTATTPIIEVVSLLGGAWAA